MRVSDLGFEAIKKFEGLRLVAYKPVPTEKYWTIGYGHYSRNIREHQSISMEEAEWYLRADIQPIESYLNKIKEINTQGKFDACADFCYNLGMTAFSTSTLLKLIRTPHLPVIIIQKEFMKWNHSNGKVLEGLTKRRAWEAGRWVE
jgi:GH24 family phage-related lysozyme (muramidase)